MPEDLGAGVRHDEARHRYELDVTGGLAVAEYHERDGARDLHAYRSAETE